MFVFVHQLVPDFHRLQYHVFTALKKNTSVYTAVIVDHVKSDATCLSIINFLFKFVDFWFSPHLFSLQAPVFQRISGKDAC